MWMLLRAAGDEVLPPQSPRGAAGDVVSAPVHRDDAADEQGDEAPAAESALDDGARLGGSPVAWPVTARAKLYLHPGRLSVGEMDAAAASEQFAFEASPVYADLAAAEAASEGKSGFLIETSGQFTDGAGHLLEGGVRFAEQLT